ncbi:MAG: ribonuclease III [Coriobacteriales bacterium]|jgi:ribonuclease-3|nr:ribonuclease III [Coriobacteriales bacterium]
MSDAFTARHLKAVETIIGHVFANKELLRRALTHPSAVEKEQYCDSYERLEFLGDSILGAIVANSLYQRFPHLDEGGMTRLKVRLVSGNSLCAVADDLGLGKHIIFGSSERGTGKRGMASALENVFEAIVAAITLDGGIKVASDFVEKNLVSRLPDSIPEACDNPKSELQENLQAKHLLPEYKLVSTTGPPHDRTFTCKVIVNGDCIGTGTGKSKKDAESQAAKEALAGLSDLG